MDIGARGGQSPINSVEVNKSYIGANHGQQIILSMPTVYTEEIGRD